MAEESGNSMASVNSPPPVLYSSADDESTAGVSSLSRTSRRRNRRRGRRHRGAVPSSSASSGGRVGGHRGGSLLKAVLDEVPTNRPSFAFLSEHGYLVRMPSLTMPIHMPVMSMPGLPTLPSLPPFLRKRWGDYQPFNSFRFTLDTLSALPSSLWAAFPATTGRSFGFGGVRGAGGSPMAVMAGDGGVFGLLPDEVVFYLFNFLSVVDIVMLCSTCKRFYDFGDDPVLWRTLYYRTWLRCPNPHAIVDWRDEFITKVETEQNWKFGRCDRLTLDCDVDGGECFVRIINPVVVVASRAGALFAFDATSRDCLWSSDLECEVNCIDFDGRQVLIGSGHNLVVISAVTCQVTHNLKAHNDAVSCVRLQEPLAVSGSMDGHVRVWDIVTGACLHVLEHLNFVSCVDLSSTMVVVGSRADRNVTVWDVKTGERLHTLEMRRAVTALRFQGHRLIVALAGCLKMEEWDLKTFKKIKTLNVMEKSHVTDLALDGERLVAASGDILAVYDTTAVTLINIGSEFGFGVSVTRAFGSEIEPLYSLCGHEDRIFSLDFDDNRIVSSSPASGVRLWNFKPAMEEYDYMLAADAAAAVTAALTAPQPQGDDGDAASESTFPRPEEGEVPAAGIGDGVALGGAAGGSGAAPNPGEFHVPGDTTDELAGGGAAAIAGDSPPRLPRVSSTVSFEQSAASATTDRRSDGPLSGVASMGASASGARRRRRRAGSGLSSSHGTHEKVGTTSDMFWYIWVLWIAYEAGAEYSHPERRRIYTVRKWVRSTLIWLPLWLPLVFLVVLSHRWPDLTARGPLSYWFLVLGLIVPWVVHSIPRHQIIKRWMGISFSFLEFALVFRTAIVLFELCDDELVMWQLFTTVAIGYSVGKGLLYVTATTLEPSRRYEMNTTLFYTPLIGMATGIAFSVEGIRSALLIIVSIVFSFIYDATGGATGDNADSMVTLFAASILGVAFPFAADLLCSAAGAGIFGLLSMLLDWHDLGALWDTYFADTRRGYGSTYWRLFFFFVVGCVGISFIKFIRNGARFHKYRKPLVRMSFWAYLVFLLGTLSRMYKHKVGGEPFFSQAWGLSAPPGWAFDPRGGVPG